MIRTEGRHPGTVALARYFVYDHLPPGPLRTTSARCEELAAGLRKLLEAKDCFVRAALDVSS